MFTMPYIYIAPYVHIWRLILTVIFTHIYLGVDTKQMQYKTITFPLTHTHILCTWLKRSVKQYTVKYLWQ